MQRREPFPDLGSTEAYGPASFQQVRSICQSFAQAWEKSRPDLAAYLAKVSEDDQATLLRNLLHYDVVKRRNADEFPRASEYIRLFPQHESLIRNVFLETTSLAFSVDDTASQARFAAKDFEPPGSRLGGYRLLRELGRGGMGAVFEAMHIRKGSRVAIKILPTVRGEALHRFKQEFRVLADISDPHLIALHTLESDGTQWFITMELLQGCDFLGYARPSGLDLGRLRSGLTQLVAGVMALHARGVVHRDLKPSNVVVTTEGRVVILDFGLVAEIQRSAELSPHIAGTPAYMAPEQAAGKRLTGAADWYAVGVMLYETLTGKRPYDGGARRVLFAKQREDPAPLPRDGTLPSDLVRLCEQLLARDPAKRPDPLRIASFISAAPTDAPRNTASADRLVGRDSQLCELQGALETFRKQRTADIVFIQGRSGEGKTSLAETFLAPLREDDSLVVMSGRCYDRESVPFKAIDTLVDSLNNYLHSLDRQEAESLMPKDVGLLAALFPVLQECPAVQAVPKGRMDALSQQQVRQRAFASLRQLIGAISRRKPVVWFIDDLHWGDEDSAKALFEVFRPPAAPGVLFVGSYRSDEADTNLFLQAWEKQQVQTDVVLAARKITVSSLSLGESSRLVVDLLGRDDELVRRRAVQFHAQAGGNPFLLTELVGCYDPESDSFVASDMQGVVQRKLGQLPLGANLLLDAVSVAGQALPAEEAVEAAGLRRGSETLITRMRNARLLRLIGTRVDTYHDRIRHAAREEMATESRRAMHSKLATVIEERAGGLTDAEIAELLETGRANERNTLPRVFDLSYHYDSAGERSRALAYSLAAAAQARKQYAREVCSQQYRVAQRNADAGGRPARLAAARGLGESLLQLGRFEQCDQQLQLAASFAQQPLQIADVKGLQGQPFEASILPGPIAALC